MIKHLHCKVFTTLLKWLPAKGKRIIFILMSYLIWSKLQNQEDIIKGIQDLNCHFGLTKNQDVLHFVITLKEVLSGLDEFKPLREIEENKPVLDKVFKSIPEYLKYDDERAMKEELSYIYSYSRSAV